MIVFKIIIKSHLTSLLIVLNINFSHYSYITLGNMSKSKQQTLSQMKKILHLVTTALLLLVSINNLKAQDVDNDGFHDGDVNVLFNVDYNNPTNLLNWTGTNYGSWEGVEWNDDLPRRVVSLSLTGKHIEKLSVANLKKLVSLTCPENESGFQYYGIWYLDISNCTSLTHLDVSGNRLENFKHSNCKTLKTVNLSKNNLETLSFVEYPELTEFNCSNNPIKDLDVSDCTKLTSFNYTDNNQLTSLKTSYCEALTKIEVTGTPLQTLKVNNCSLLKKIICPNNKISTLIFSDCDELTGIDVTRNELTAINFSNCNKLDTILAANNLLTSIDISNYPLVRKLEVHNNKLESLNTQNLLLLTDLKLSDNEITNLDITGCNALSTLNCHQNQLQAIDISGCDKLSNLDLSNNKIESLNFEGNTLLTELKCQYNSLNSLIVSGCTELTYLDCSHNKLLDLNIEGLRLLDNLNCYNNSLELITLGNNDSLSNLNLQHNNLISLEIDSCPELITLQCNLNKLTKLDVTNCTKIESFDCRYNYLESLNTLGCIALTSINHETPSSNSTYKNAIIHINTSGCTALASLEFDGKIIETLNASNCISLTEIEFYNPGSSNGSTNLKELNISGCIGLTSITCNYQDLEELNLTNCSSLTSLNLKGNWLKTVDLTGLSNLETLNIEYNHIVNLDLANLEKLKSWKLCSSVRRIRFTNCKSIIQFYRKNANLIYLDFTNCTGLKSIYCEGNNVDYLNLTGCSELQILDCEENKLTALDFTDCSKLEDLNCTRNEIEELTFSTNNSLTNLECGINQISTLDISAFPNLTSLTCNHNNLKTLDFSNNTKLENIICPGNEFESLDFTSTANIQSISCGSNKLTSLNISDCPQLNSINCSRNYLPFSILSTFSHLPTLTSKTFFPQNLVFEKKTIALGESIDYSSEEMILGESSTFNWFNDDEEIGVHTAVFTPTEAGIYYCKMENTNYPGKEIISNKVIASNSSTAPSDILLSNNTVTENIHSTGENYVGYEIGTLTHVDADDYDIITYSIADNPYFEVREDKLRTITPFDFETEPNSYTATITATDYRGNTFTKDFTITITDLNDYPNTPTLSNSKIAENSEAGTIVGTFDVSDPDNTINELTVTLTNGEEWFYLDGFDLKTKEPLDHEVFSNPFRSVDITVQDKDGAAIYPGYTITILDVNEKPENIQLSANTIAENIEVGTEVGRISATDPDEDDKITYSVVENDYFKVTDDKLITKSVFDFETNDTHTISISATDIEGLTILEEVIINVSNVNEAPSEIALSSSTIAENSAIGTEIGTITVTDKDKNDSTTISLVEGQADNSKFSIIDGKLVSNSEIDFESIKSFTVAIKAVDFAGLELVKEFNLSVDNVNETPVSISLSSSEIAENQAVGSEIGILSTTDTDEDDTHSYSIISGSDFEIDGNKLISNKSFDFETKDSFTLRIKSTDQDGLFIENEFTINVTNLNESPTNLQLSSNTISENTTIGTEVGILSADDVDTGDVLVFSIASNDNFEINDDKLITKSTFNYEEKSSYIINLIATDAAGLKVEKEFTIEISDINESPTDLVLSNKNIEELASIGTVIGTISAIDLDKDDVLTYSIAENANFEIKGNELMAKSIFDFETKSAYTIIIIVTDAEGLQTEKEFTITITNVNEAPTALSLSNNVIEENAPIGTAVGTLTAEDVDNADVLNYTLVENENFEINGNELIAKTTFDYESKSIFTVNITVMDAAGLSLEKSFNISINDVNEAPTLIELSSNTVEENAEAGFTIGTLSSHDKDANDEISLTIGTNDDFKLEDNQLITNSVFNYEEQSSYSLSITATDKMGLSVTKEFEIEVIDINEAPEFISEPNTSAMENIEYVYDIECSDIDGDEITIEATEKPSWLTLTNNNGNFRLVGTPLQSGDYNITLSLSDGSIICKQEFIISVDQTVGIDEINFTQDVKIYPNPVINELHIEITNVNSDEVTISLFALTGSLIFKESHNSNIGSLKIEKSIQNLRSGIYMLQIEAENSKKTYKIIKR